MYLKLKEQEKDILSFLENLKYKNEIIISNPEKFSDNFLFNLIFNFKKINFSGINDNFLNRFFSEYVEANYTSDFFKFNLKDKLIELKSNYIKIGKDYLSDLKLILEKDFNNLSKINRIAIFLFINLDVNIIKNKFKDFLFDLLSNKIKYSFFNEEINEYLNLNIIDINCNDILLFDCRCKDMPLFFYNVNKTIEISEQYNLKTLIVNKNGIDLKNFGNNLNIIAEILRGTKNGINLFNAYWYSLAKYLAKFDLDLPSDNSNGISFIYGLKENNKQVFSKLNDVFTIRGK